MKRRSFISLFATGIAAVAAKCFANPSQTNQKAGGIVAYLRKWENDNSVSQWNDLRYGGIHTIKTPHGNVALIQHPLFDKIKSEAMDNIAKDIERRLIG